LGLAFAPSANASIVGSTYDFTTSESGNTLIAPVRRTQRPYRSGQSRLLRRLNRQPAGLCYRRGCFRLL
jgi:hypothetical protein